MSSRAREQNNIPIPVRSGLPIGGLLTPNPTADTWYRLMPSGSIAKRLTETTLHLGAYENGQYGSPNSGTAFPGSPEAGDLFRFDADVASGIAWEDEAGNGITSASENEVARYGGSDWVRQFGLRADIRNSVFYDWRLLIKSEGHMREHRIDKIDGSIATIQDGGDSSRDKRRFSGQLLRFVEYVLSPILIKEFYVTNADDSDDTVQIGMINKDVYDPADADIWILSEIAPAKSYELPFDAVDRIFYRYPDVTAATPTNKLIWGEHHQVN